MILAAALIAIPMPCRVVDGDTIACAGERIRLLGIDAPELHHCRKGRHCAPGDPFASKRALRATMQGKTITIKRVGRDRYGRTLGIVYAGLVNTSCAQLAGGFASYKRQWDNGGAVARDCPGVAR